MARHPDFGAAVLPKQEVRNAVRAPNGDLDLERLRQRVIDDPADTVARIELAAYYDRIGMKELALEHYRLIGVRRPEDENAHLRYAQQVRETNPNEARRELTEFLAAYPARLADTYSLLAILEDQAGDLKAGEALHRKAVDLAPKSDRLHNNLGFNLAQQSRHGDAIKAFRKALELNGKSEVARNNLAASLAESNGQMQAAFEIWKRSAGQAQAHNNLGALYLRNGRLTDARREFEQALRLSPALPEAWRNLAKVSELDGQPAQMTVNGTGTASGKGWRTLAESAKKVFGNGGSKPPVTEVGEGRIPSNEKINKRAE